MNMDIHNTKTYGLQQELSKKEVHRNKCPKLRKEELKKKPKFKPKGTRKRRPN